MKIPSRKIILIISEKSKTVFVIVSTIPTTAIIIIIMTWYCFAFDRICDFFDATVVPTKE